MPAPETASPHKTSTEPSGDAKLDQGFRRLTLDDFEVFQGKSRPETPTWTSDGTTIRCSGKPRGYLYSKTDHRNFTLRADLRYPPAAAADAAKANTGFFVYLTLPHRVWPVCFEVQGKHPEMAMIKGNGKPNPLDPAKVKDDEAARQRARRPLGEWNSFEIISRDGKVTALLNGTKISENEPVALREGSIGLQAEDAPYEVRNLVLRDE